MAAWSPTIDDVALELRARTQEVAGPGQIGGDQLGTFTANTRPTAVEVARYIDEATADILAVFTAPALPVGVTKEAQRAVTLRAAHAIEISYFPELSDTDASAYLQLAQRANQALEALVKKAQLLDLFAEMPAVVEAI